jgi:hypothetical protein
MLLFDPALINKRHHVYIPLLLAHGADPHATAVYRSDPIGGDVLCLNAVEVRDVHLVVSLVLCFHDCKFFEFRRKLHNLCVFVYVCVFGVVCSWPH